MPEPTLGMALLMSGTEKITEVLQAGLTSACLASFNIEEKQSGAQAEPQFCSPRPVTGLAVQY